jgi:hypothetical protein
MTENPLSSSSFVKNLKIINLALFSGLVFFACISFYARNKVGSTLTIEQLEILTYISLIFMLIEIPLGYWLHNKKMKSVANLPDLNSKLESYKASHIIKIALFEGVGFLGSIVLLLGGKNVILLQIAIVLIFILLNTPSVNRLTNELNLTPDESNLLND